MNTDELVGLLRAEATAVEQRVPNTSWFLFGSVVEDAASAEDVDLHVLCSAEGDARDMRKILGGLCLQLPLHLMLVTKDEERELDFIAKQSCQRIYPG